MGLKLNSSNLSLCCIPGTQLPLHCGIIGFDVRFGRKQTFRDYFASQISRNHVKLIGCLARSSP
jgi:hypothetical protein